MYNNAFDHMLRLLCIGMYGHSAAPVASPGVSLSESTWQQVLEEAEKQTVTGITFSAFSSLPESEIPPVSVLTRWLAITHRNVSNYASMTEVLSRVVTLLEGHGLHPVLQKGHGVARFYHKPELRICGDIDLWFPQGECQEADKIIRALGHDVVTTPDRGSCYVCGSAEVEHHSMLVEIHNPFKSGLISDLCSVYPPVRATVAGGPEVSLPAPMIELLMINTHILKHCLGMGIGLRQFCDYALAWRRLTASHGSNPPQVNADEYFRLCQQLGVMGWTRVLHQFINRYLPAPDGNAVADIPGPRHVRAVNRIFRLVAEGGNFGRFSKGKKPVPPKSMWRRKMHTMMAFLGNRSFVFKLAPAEAFWTVTRLLAGQIH